MLFTESRFLPFFLIVLGVHWALRGNRPRKLWLLAASYCFYGAWDWRFLSLIAGSTLVDYVVGLRLAASSRRRAWLLVSVVVNLGLLGVFKYFNFFLESAVELLSWLGFEPHVTTLRIILPVGISFYTFQTMSYSLDVYFRRLRPTRDLLDLATFVAFFPQLVAGPIVRASTFLPQLRERRRWSSVEVRPALILFLVGYFKKACVSDNLAPLVDRYFLAPETWDVYSAWMATLAYAVQIYCDFSGYTDMAIACAALLGYELVLNFDFPYFSANVTQFWRRWHMSLSSWLRDYLYIPLGGNRGSLAFTYRNLLLTMLLGGLWHGAAWNFVVWGALHGVALIVHREWQKRVPGLAPRVEGRLPFTLARVAFTFWFACVCWIFFRAVGLHDALSALRGFALLRSPGDGRLGAAFPWIFAALAALHLVAYRRWLSGWWRRLPAWGFAACYALLVAGIQPLVARDAAPFIYFQF